ncbi:unnamed protein product [Alopecurus aequalis]
MASRSGTREPEETFPGWVMLDRFGRTSCHDGQAAADEAVNNDDAAAAVQTGHSCYFSFTLAAPPKVSYLDLHWPELPAKSAFVLPAYSKVLAADGDLVLLRISVEPRHNRAPCDLFVYAAGHPSSPPSALRLPLPAEPSDDDDRPTNFLRQNFGIGILRIAPAAVGGQDRGYIVADLAVSDKKKRISPRLRADHDSSNNSGSNPKFATLCVFSSETGTWRIITRRTPPPQRSNGGQFPAFWRTDDVLPFDGRFLCWVDYFKGLLLSDFSSKITSPVLHFVPFPGIQYTNDMIPSTMSRSFLARFRSVAVSQGRMRFVHIDNDWHERDHSFNCSDCLERKRQKLGSRITIWTMENMIENGGNLRFQWEVHRVINLDCLWAQIGYQDQGLPRRLPEFPVIAADDPDVLCCVLREEEFRGKTWMIMVDMKYAYLRACTPYNNFRDVPLLPSVSLKTLNRPTGN